MGFPGGTSSKEPACQCKRCKRQDMWVRSWGREDSPGGGHGSSIPGVGKIPLQEGSTSVFLPRESHGQRSLAVYSPQGHKELDTTEAIQHMCIHREEQMKASDICSCIQSWRGCVSYKCRLLQPCLGNLDFTGRLGIADVIFQKDKQVLSEVTSNQKTVFTPVVVILENAQQVTLQPLPQFVGEYLR